MSYEEVVETCHQINKPKHILGNPSIDYEDDANGKCGLLFPGEKVKCKDGTTFNIDFWHNA